MSSCASVHLGKQLRPLIPPEGDLHLCQPMARVLLISASGPLQAAASSCLLRDCAKLLLGVQVRLKHSKEVVCLAMTDSLVAVGSQSHISLIDPRKKAPVQEVESLDESHGEQCCPTKVLLRHGSRALACVCSNMIGLKRGLGCALAAPRAVT